MEHGTLPNLLIIGAMKCGTTSLHDYLGLHPDIFMSRKKELNYFIDPNWEANLNAYRAHFIKGCQHTWRGESSPSYSKVHRHGEKVVERISNTLPGVKIIYLVRDPIKRIISHYYEAQEGGYAPSSSLNQFLANVDKNHYVLTSAYYYQISSYLKFVDPKNILVVSSELLLNNRLAVLNEIYEFLGVAPVVDESLFAFESNTHSSKKRQTWFGKFAMSSQLQGIRDLLPRGVKNTILNHHLFQLISRAPLRSAAIDANLEADIRAFLQPDVEQLRLFTGKDFSEWSM